MISQRWILVLFLIGVLATVHGRIRRIKCTDLEHLGGSDLACSIYCMVRRDAEGGRCYSEDECVCEEDNSMESSTDSIPTTISDIEIETRIGSCLLGVGACVDKCKKKGFKRGGWCDGGTFGVCRCHGRTG